MEKQKTQQIEKDPKAYKKFSFAEELARFFLKKGEVWVVQEDILKEMIKLGFSKSYAYMRLKKYSQGIVKRSISINAKPDILEPLVIEESRYKFDKTQGLVYRLNDDWKNYELEKIRLAFEDT